MNKSRDEKQTFAQKETKWLVLKTGTTILAEKNEYTKGKETKLMTTDSDINLVDTENEVMGWKEDQRRARNRPEEEKSKRKLHSASLILVMLRAGERCLWHRLKTATKDQQALGFLLAPASFLRRTSFSRCLTGTGGQCKETQGGKTATLGNTQHGRGTLPLLRPHYLMKSSVLWYVMEQLQPGLKLILWLPNSRKLETTFSSCKARQNCTHDFSGKVQ